MQAQEDNYHINQTFIDNEKMVKHFQICLLTMKNKDLMDQIKNLMETEKQRQGIISSLFKLVNQDVQIQSNAISFNNIIGNGNICQSQPDREIQTRLQQQEDYANYIKKFVSQIGMNEVIEEKQQQQAPLNQQTPPQQPNNSQQSSTLQQSHQSLYRQMCIQRYKNKRRNWQKSVSYDCRKKVADNRLRIKGRFISKEDQKNISDLLNTKSSIEQVFDKKKNLDIKKFQQTIKLFSSSKGIRKTSKKEVLSQIYTRVIQKKALLERIQNKQQIFQLVQ